MTIAPAVAGSTEAASFNEVKKLTASDAEAGAKTALQKGERAHATYPSR